MNYPPIGSTRVPHGRSRTRPGRPRRPIDRRPDRPGGGKNVLKGLRRAGARRYAPRHRGWPPSPGGLARPTTGPAIPQRRRHRHEDLDSRRRSGGSAGPSTGTAPEVTRSPRPGCHGALQPWPLPRPTPWCSTSSSRHRRLEVCRGWRGNDTPVLMLTARDAVERPGAGTRRRADDYLVKPFALANSWPACEPLLSAHGRRGRESCVSPTCRSTRDREARGRARSPSPGSSFDLLELFLEPPAPF